MKYQTIKDIGTVISGSTPDTSVEQFWNGKIPWVTPKEISKLSTPFLNETQRSITDAGLKSCSTTILPKGSVLFTSRAPIGLVAIANIDVATNQGFKSIKLNSGYYPLYIYYALKYFSRRIEYLGTGSTFKELSRGSLENFELPIPSIEDQVKYASTLLKIERLIRLREVSIENLEKALSSNFDKIFGDPIRNERRWKFRKLEDLVTSDCKLSYGIVQPGGEYPGGVPVIRPVDMKDNFIKKSKLKHIDPKISNRHKHTILKGNEILLCVRGTTGLVSLLTADLKGCNVTRGIVPIRFDNLILQNFAFQLFKSQQVNREIQKYTYGSALRQINIADLRNLFVICPPLKLQKRYADFVEKILLIKRNFIVSHLELNNLFNSLCQRIFENNESTNFDRVPLDQNEIKKYQFTGNVDKFSNRSALQTDNISETHNKQLPVAVKQTSDKSKLVWDDVATETLAKLISEKYKSYHFNSEMLQIFLLEEHFKTINYFSSEDLKKNPGLNSKQDLKKFLVDALDGVNPYMRLKQHFYNAKLSEIELKINPTDANYFSEKEANEISGIFFSIEEQ